MFIYILLFLLVIIVIFFAIGYDMFRILMLPSKTNSKARKKINDIELSVKDKLNNSFSGKWFEGVNKEEVYINSADGYKLHACKIVNKRTTNKWVVMMHGYFSNLSQLSNYALEFYQEDYNILMLDSRACGKSEGKYVGLAYRDKDDLGKWIEYLNEDKVVKITLFGVSMGASTILLACSEKKLASVEKIIVDSAYSSMANALKVEMKNVYGLPEFLSERLLGIVSFYLKIFVGFKLNDVAPINNANKIDIPTLVIHCTRDTLVPYEMAELLFSRLTCDKELLSIDDANHCEGCWINLERYWNKIFEFVSK